MPYRQILPITDPRLIQRSAEIELVDGKVPADIKLLAVDLFDTSRAVSGAGMAAVQVGELVRLFVMDLKLLGGNSIAFVNPTITHFSEERGARKEGCLSMPGVALDLDRAETITIAYTDLQGDAQTYEASGYDALCIQHEMDHLDGIRHIDHLSPLKRERALKKYKTHIARPPAAAPVQTYQVDVDGEPACNISGQCEPFDSEAQETQAMCQHCGGWRYRDWPYPGNWGTWEPALETKWEHLSEKVTG